MIALTATLAWGVWLCVCAVNIILAGLFAGMETGIYLLNRVQLELQAEAGFPQARTLRNFLRNGDNALAVLLIGTNVHQYLAAFAISVMFVMGGFGEQAEWYALAVTTPLLFVFKDSVPKNIFQRAPRVLVYSLARPLRAADLLFKAIGLTYVVRLFASGLLRLGGRKKSEFSLMGHEGLLAVVAEGHAAGAITLSQRDMADRVMRLGEVHVADVMQPMDKVIRSDVDETYQQFCRRVDEHDYSRLPVVAAGGKVVGVVNVYDVLTGRADRPVAECMAQPLVIPAGTNVTHAMYTMQRAKCSLAVVSDEQGEHVGIITIKDLVEEIVGELEEW